MQHTVPLRVLLFESWSLPDELVSMARSRHKDGIRLLTKHSNLETHSCVLKDTTGTPLRWEGPPRAVEALGPLLPPTAYRAITGGEQTYSTFPRAGRLPGLGNVRRVVRCTSAAWTGTDVVLGTNRVDGGAQRSSTLSLQRWPIDTFSQDGTGPLGLDASRMRNAAALQKHCCLVCVA